MTSQIFEFLKFMGFIEMFTKSMTKNAYLPKNQRLIAIWGRDVSSVMPR